MSEEREPDKCTVCDGALRHHFSQIKYKETWAYLCCSVCSEAFMENRDFIIVKGNSIGHKDKNLITARCGTKIIINEKGK